MRISLLRAPTHPDPEADQGGHQFAYSLLPHTGRWNETTIAEAYALNDPLLVVKGYDNKKPAGESFMSVDQPNVVIETVKQADNGRGIIIRLYESQRQRGEVTLTTNFEIGDAWEANLLEKNQVALSPVGNTVSFFIKPYQIVTLRLVPA